MKRFLPVLLAAAAAVAGTAWWLRPPSVLPAGSISQNIPKSPIPAQRESIPPTSGEIPESAKKVLKPLTRDEAGPVTADSSSPLVSEDSFATGNHPSLDQASALRGRPSGNNKSPRATRRGTDLQHNTSPPTTGEDSGAGASGAPELTVPFSLTNPGQPAAIPAALTLQTGGPGLTLTDVEKAGIDQLAADFLAQTATGSQDPQDPGYQKLWAEAAALSDARLRSRFGGETWLRQHAEAYRQALGNTPPDLTDP